MKLCPQCRRGYDDETLKFCLDDGNSLVDGPASGGKSAPPIFHPSEPPSEASTRGRISNTDETAVYPDWSQPRETKRHKLALTLGAFVLLTACIGGGIGIYKLVF